PRDAPVPAPIRDPAGRCGDRAAGPAGGVLGLVRRLVGAPCRVLQGVQVTRVGRAPRVLGCLGRVVGEAAQPAEGPHLLDDLGFAVAGDEQGPDVPQHRGDGAGAVAAVPLVGHVVADERVVEDRPARAQRGAAPAEERAEVIAVVPLVPGAGGVAPPVAAEGTAVVHQAVPGLDRAGDDVPHPGEVAPHAVDEQAPAELPELVPGAPEERPDAGETAVAVPVGVGAFGVFGVFGVFGCGGRVLVRGFVDLVPGGDGVGRVEGGGGAGGVGGAGGGGGGGVLRTAAVAVAVAGAAGVASCVPAGSARAVAGAAPGGHVARARVGAGCRAGRAGDAADLRLDAGQDLCA